MTIESREVSLTEIRMDGGTQPRAELDDALVAEYADEMKGGAEFPPVTVFYDGVVYWVADGFHRVKARQANGGSTIRAEIHQGRRRDALLYAVGANAEHGKRRTNADKRRAVETLLGDGEWGRWSNREIAKRAAVSEAFVRSLRTTRSDEVECRTKHGTTTTMNTAKIGGTPKPKVGNNGTDRPPVGDEAGTGGGAMTCDGGRTMKAAQGAPSAKGEVVAVQQVAREILDEIRRLCKRVKRRMSSPTARADAGIYSAVGEKAVKIDVEAQRIIELCAGESASRYAEVFGAREAVRAIQVQTEFIRNLECDRIVQKRAILKAAENLVAAARKVVQEHGDARVSAAG